jgi:glutamyl-tRNA reductase
VAGERFVEVGTDFQASSLDVLSRARLSGERIPGFLQRIRERGTPEVALLSTCNRFEVYAATDNPAETAAVLEEEVLAVLGGNGHVELVVRHDRDAVAHLVAVAAGLESALLGEHEILGQVRRAHGAAVQAGTAGESLGRLFDYASRRARRIRRALGISKLRRSLTELAADWIATRLDESRRRFALIVGAGETASQMAAHLRDLRFEELTIANRSLERSHAVAETVGGRAERLERLPELLPQADLLVLATSASEPLLTEAGVREALETRPKELIVVDLGLTPNAEEAVSRHPSVVTLTLSDVIGLALVESRQERPHVQRAEKLVQEAVDEFTARAASTV